MSDEDALVTDVPDNGQFKSVMTYLSTEMVDHTMGNATVKTTKNIQY